MKDNQWLLFLIPLTGALLIGMLYCFSLLNSLRGDMCRVMHSVDYLITELKDNVPDEQEDYFQEKSTSYGKYGNRL